MPLPTFDCPVCRNPLTWDVVFAHQGVRDSMLALVNAHPEGRKLLRPLLSYVTLFSPKKAAMRYERVASLVNELVEMIREAQIERNGQVWAAPLAYWQRSLEEVVSRAHAGALRTPLSSHGYLLEVIADQAGRAEANAERQIEAQRAGHAGAGTAPARMQAVTLAEPAPRAAIPEQVRQEMLRAAKSRRADNNSQQDNQ